MESQVAQVWNDAQQICDDKSTKITNQVNDLQQKVESQVAQVWNDAQQICTDRSRQIIGQATDVQQRIESHVEQVWNTAQQAANARSNQITENLNNLVKVVEDTRSNLVQEIGALTARWQETQSTSQQQAEDLQKQQDSTQQQLAEFTAYVEKRVLDFDRQLKTSLDDIVQSYEQRKVDLISMFNSQLSDYNQEFCSRCSKRCDACT